MRGSLAGRILAGWALQRRGAAGSRQRALHRPGLHALGQPLRSECSARDCRVATRPCAQRHIGSVPARSGWFSDPIFAHSAWPPT